MSPAPTPTAEAGAPAGRPGGRPATGPVALAKRQPVVVVAVAGGALGLFVLLRKRASSGPAKTQTVIQPAGRSDTVASDVVNTIQPEIDALARMVGELKSAGGSGAPQLPLPNPTGFVLPPAPPGFGGTPGETIADFIKTPSGQGGWYLTNLGGVWTFGDAPYLGSYLDLRPADRQGERAPFTGITATKGGYAIRTATGETYNFPAY